MDNSDAPQPRTPQERADAMRRSANERIDEGFTEFLAHPLTRMAMSLIPPVAQGEETLKALLHAAFIAGSNAGRGSIAYELMTELEKREKRK